MNLLYIGYWSVYDGLSESSIRPHLEVLSNLKRVKKIFYVSIERKDELVSCQWELPKLRHIAFYSPHKPFMRDKLSDLIILPQKLLQLIREEKIDKVICRSAPAGILGYLLWKKSKLPYFVESFEPHSEYMLESGVWRIWDIRYWLQRYFEFKQKKTASGLMPVSENYKKHLLESDRPKCPISTIPCSVNIEKFKFSQIDRQGIRAALGIDEEAMVGVYVGKFGDIYYDREAFDFFNHCVKRLPGFFLIILTPQDKKEINRHLEKRDFPSNKYWVGRVGHNEVVSYLSASDFAFSLHKMSKFSFAFSPIKNGEYWANGLPILISDGIGDDADIVHRDGGGIVVNFENIDNDIIEEILVIIKKSSQDRNGNQSIRNAKTHRSIDSALKVYDKIV